VVLDLHLQIKTGELAEMSVGVRVFSPEHRANLKDSLEITAKRHLLVELRALGEAGWLPKVFQFEDVGTALR
jgi:hypothetical protein